MIICSWLVVAFHFLSLCIVWEVMIHYVRKIENLQQEKHSDITGAIKYNSDYYLMTFDPQMLFICQCACVFFISSLGFYYCFTTISRKLLSSYITSQERT